MATRRPLVSVNARRQQMPVGDDLPTDTLSNALAVVLAGLVVNNTAGIAATDTIVSALGKLQAQISSGAGVGSTPNQVPAGTLLGSGAFMGGLNLVYLHTPDAQLYEVWRERVSDTETTIKFRGADGVVRSRKELWT